MVPNPSATSFIFNALLYSMLLTLGISWVSIRLSNKVKLIDFPGSAPHKLHLQPTPIAGGIAMLTTLFICDRLLGATLDVNVRATLIAIIPIFIFGLWDDYKNISPPLKLTSQIAAALILIRMGVYIKIFESPDFFIYGQGPSYIYLDWLLTIFWVVGVTNAFNFVDSMDGLAVGLGGMAAAFFMLVTLDSQQPLLSLHSTVVLGICFGLYFYNAPPARLFLGDSGAQSLGLIMAVLAIGYSPRDAYQTSSWFIPILLLGVPIFDAVLVVLSRLRRRQPVYTAALDHTYHRLLRLGLDSNRAVLTMHFAALLLSSLAFVLLGQPPLVANFMFVLLALAGCWALVFLDSKKVWL
jgi:UDP-GlcNAc:undecaprenyl-phosphate GlcNAc-1-phosphate transferase